MSDSKKGSLASSLRNDCRRIDKKYILFIPLILLSVGIFVRWVCGSPVAVIHMLGVASIVPPVWLMVLLSSASYVAGGVALGSALGWRACARNDKKYQGAMWFCIMASLSYVWYPIFFCSNLFFVSTIVSSLCLFCAICATVCFACVSFLSFWSMILYDIWLLYLMLLNFQVFFSV